MLKPRQQVQASFVNCSSFKSERLLFKAFVIKEIDNCFFWMCSYLLSSTCPSHSFSAMEKLFTAVVRTTCKSVAEERAALKGLPQLLHGAYQPRDQQYLDKHLSILF